jgi:hypothetical protein
MTDALRTDLNDFLFTAIAEDGSGMHLTMLSALARSGVDPWAEAAGLASLSRENATQKLVQMLAGIPNGPSPGDETTTLAARLVAHLHSSPPSRLKPIPSIAAVARGDGPPLLSLLALPKPVRLAIYSVVALILMALGYRALSGGEPATSDDISMQQSR